MLRPHLIGRMSRFHFGGVTPIRFLRSIPILGYGIVPDTCIAYNNASRTTEFFVTGITSGALFTLKVYSPLGEPVGVPNATSITAVPGYPEEYLIEGVAPSSDFLLIDNTSNFVGREFTANDGTYIPMNDGYNPDPDPTDRFAPLYNATQQRYAKAANQLIGSEFSVDPFIVEFDCIVYSVTAGTLVSTRTGGQSSNIFNFYLQSNNELRVFLGGNSTFTGYIVPTNIPLTISASFGVQSGGTRQLVLTINGSEIFNGTVSSGISSNPRDLYIAAHMGTTVIQNFTDCTVSNLSISNPTSSYMWPQITNVSGQLDGTDTISGNNLSYFNMAGDETDTVQL